MIKLQSKAAAPHVANDLGAHAFAKQQAAAHRRLLGAVDHGDPQTAPVVGKALEQKHFDFATALLGATQPRRKNFGIVKHQEIAGIEKLAQFGEDAVNNFAAAAPNHQ